MNEVMNDLNLDNDSNIEETSANDDQDLINAVDGFVNDGGINTIKIDDDMYDDANDGSKETITYGVFRTFDRPLETGLFLKRLGLG